MSNEHGQQWGQGDRNREDATGRHHTQQYPLHPGLSEDQSAHQAEGRNPQSYGPRSTEQTAGQTEVFLPYTGEHRVNASRPADQGWSVDHQGRPQQAHPGQQGPAQPHGAQPGPTQFGQDHMGADPAGGDLAVEEKPKKRWSTPAVAALLLAGAVAASATTAVVMNELTARPTSGVVTSSFDRSGDGDSSAPAPEPGSVGDVAERVLPSVVSIQVMGERGAGEGSGSIISSDGVVLTNNHVVSMAGARGRITVLLHDGRTLNAKIVATDPSTDIAVIKADGANDLKPITVGDSDKVGVGQDVVAVGSPLGLASTVTSGIVSAKNRPVQAGGELGGEGSLIDAIQTDAAINLGNSGGALVDRQGELIGIPSAIATAGGSTNPGSIGLGFAIPSNQAMEIAKQLIDNGEVAHPIIGAQINTQSEAIGAEIRSTSPGSPAEKAGLKEGDIVVRVDDRVVDSGVGLIAAIRSHRVGDEVTLTVLDGPNGKERTVTLTLSSE